MTFPSRTRILYDVSNPPPVQLESIEAQDRRNCIALDKEVDGANRELGQWLVNHPGYSNSVVAGWLACGKTRIADLRIWAKNGFVGNPSDSRRKRADHTSHGRRADREPLKTKDNSKEAPDPDWAPGVELPSRVLANVLDSIKDSKAVAEAYRKIFKVSSFDSEAKAEIKEAIKQLVVKWQITKSTLDKEGQGNG